MFKGGELSSPAAAAAAEGFDINNKRMKKMKNNKRRFSDEQIKSLESIFEKEPQLEPRKKVEVARELGLQPRQVAIWFQNKRARWKSRQLETEFSLLRSNYNALSSRFDSLAKDKHSLLLQLHKLKELMGMSTQEGSQFDGGTTIVNDRESHTNNNDDDNNNNKGKQSAEAEEQKPMEEGTEYGGVGMLSDDGCSHQTTTYFPMDDAGLLPMVEPTCSSLSSDEEWQSLHPQALFDRSTTTCDWWDFPLVDGI